MKNRASVAALVVLASCGMAMAQFEAKNPNPKAVPGNAQPANKAQPEAKKKATLKVGDPAPALALDSFVKGESVSSFDKGRVYVVEFWATWCPPCLDSIPHLTKIQKEHKELTIIGVAASERTKKDGPDERLAKLKTFVEKQDKKMEYRVAYDSKRAMTATWMEAAGQGGIPTAFVVDGDGKLAFIGHPMDDGFEPAIKAALTKASKAPAATEPPATPKTPK